MRIAYLALEPALPNKDNLLTVAQSVVVSQAFGDWDLIAKGAGTPPVRIGEGWLRYSMTLTVSPVLERPAAYLTAPASLCMMERTRTGCTLEVANLMAAEAGAEV